MKVALPHIPIASAAEARPDILGAALKSGLKSAEKAIVKAISTSTGVDLGPVVTHHFPLTDVAGAFGAANRRAGLKVVVEPAPERP